MPKLKALLSFIIIASQVLLGCSSIPEKSQSYSEAAYFDKNTPPAKFVPRAPASSEGVETIDPLYMRTQADYHFSLAEAYSLDGNVQKAIEAYKTVLLYDPDSATVMLRLASEFLKLGLTSQATQFTESALRIDPKNVEGYILLGGLYSANKLYDPAIRQYETVMKIDPNNQEAPMYLGAVYAEKKQYDKAIQHFKKLDDNEEYSNPHLPSYYIGRIYAEQKKWKEAEKYFKKSIAKRTEFTDAVLSLGSVYGKMNQPEKAIEIYRKYQKENGPSLRIAEILAQVYIEEENYEEALLQLKVLEENSEDVLSVKLKISLILIEQKKYPEAIKKLKETLDIEPESDKIRFYLAAVYEEINDYPNAIKEFRKIPAESGFFEDSVVHAGYLLRNSDKLDDAISVVETGLSKKKDSPQIYALYASLLDEKGDYQKAMTSLAEANQLFPENAQILFYLGTVYDKLQKPEEVEKTMKKVLELDKDHVNALNYLAYSWADKSTNLVQAEAMARRALALSQEDGFIMDTLGWVLFKQGRVKEAIPYLQAAANAQPNEAIILEHLGDAYHHQQMYMAAREMYMKVLGLLDSKDNKQKEIQDKISSIEIQNVDGVKRQPASFVPRPKPMTKSP